MRPLDDLTMYVYGLLDVSAESEIRDHAKRCRECGAQIERIAAEHRLLEKALRTEAPREAGSPRPEKGRDSQAERHRGRLRG